MNNNTILLKIKERLNKLDSADFADIDPWMIVEAFNKEQSDWTRRQLEGINQTRTGSDGSRRRIDDLQVILTTIQLTGTANSLYWESVVVPDNYMEWCRVSTMGKDICCPARRFIVFEGEESDRDIDLADSNRQPSFQWATTFSTIVENKVRIYTNNEFTIVQPELMYYRQPRNIEIIGIANPNDTTGAPATVEVTCEFKDSIVEVIIEGAAAIIAGDIDNYIKSQQLIASQEHNN